MSVRLIVLSTLIVSGLSIGSRILGFVREMIFAANFGISAGMDAFLIAQLVPCTIGTILATSLVAALIPVFNIYSAGSNGIKERNAFEKQLITWILLISGIFIIAALFGAPSFITLIMTRWPEEIRSEAIRLTWIMLPCFVFSQLLAVANGLQQANSRFVFPYLGPIVFNLTIILGIFFFGKTHNIMALGYSTTLGTFLQLAVQWSGLKKLQLNFKLVRLSQLKVPRELTPFLVPALLITLLNDSAFVIDRLLASFFPPGSIAALNYAYRVNSIIISLIAASVAVASYPVITACVARRDYVNMNINVSISIRMLIFAIIPATTVFLLFSHQFVGLLFLRGAFDESAALITGSALFFLSFGMIGAAGMAILGQPFCALQDKRTLTIVAASMIGTKLFISVILMEKMAVDGLALATSSANILSCGLLLYFWSRRFSLHAKEAIMRAIRQVTVATGTMVLIAEIIIRISESAVYPDLASGKAAGIIILFVTISVSLCAYLGTLACLKSEEFLWFKNLVMRKVKGKLF